MTSTTVCCETSAAAIRHMRLLYCRFTLKAVTPLRLPPYKGSAFRGGFGHALKQIACSDPQKHCDRCEQPEHCVYSYLFETKIEQGGAGDEMIPHPFVLIPPLETYPDYEPGDILTCDLVLIGDAIDYLPYFIAGLGQLGHQGIGKSKGRYAIASVQCLSPNAPAYELYSGADDRFAELRAPTTGHELVIQHQAEAPERLTMSFITPTRSNTKDALSSRHHRFTWF